MTRRALAKWLSKDITARGQHYHNGSTVWCTLDGEWGSHPGIAEPPRDASFYDWMGWDQHADRNTVLKVETALKRLEKARTGKAPRVNRRSLKHSH